MDLLDYLGTLYYKPEGKANNLELILNRYFNKKPVALESISVTDEETKKYYSMIDEIVRDGRYVTENLNLYISSFNITSEIPDFMKPWIKEEYKKYSALKATNESLQLGINLRYGSALKKLLKDSPVENFLSQMLLRLSVEKIFIDDEFFDNIEYIVSYSGVMGSKIYSEIDSWKNSFKQIYKQKYADISFI